MQIRKEQGLLIAVVLLGAWIWSGSGSAPASTRLAPRKKEHVPLPALVVPTVEEAGDAPTLRRDLFMEPSESAPLPPVRLSMPPLAALPVVALPLVPGQQPGAFHDLRLAGGVVEKHDFHKGEQGANGGASSDAPASGNTSPASNGSSATNGNATPVPAAQQDPKAGTGSSPQSAPGYERTWDRVLTTSGEVYWGEILGDKERKYALPDQATFAEPVHLRWINEHKGTVIKPDLAIPIEQIKKVYLADTSRNNIELRKRKIRKDAASLQERGAFIEYLLALATEEPWVYSEAKSQADLFIELTKGGEEGYEWKARVLQASGDLGGLYELFAKLPEPLQASAFRWRGLGQLEARLTLWDDAEKHLRQAVQAAPIDARSNQALARYLLERGRAAQALQYAEVAQRNRTVLGDVERAGITATLIAVQLALGKAKEARDLIGSMPDVAEKGYLRGAIAYALGEVDAANGAFQLVANSNGGSDAALGVGACQLRAKEWDQAETSLLAVADQDPLLRHRALAGLGLLYERTGNQPEALSQLEAALVADPSDPYVDYLLGRERRLAGQLEGAVEALREALLRSDELQEALAETAMAELARATGSEEKDAQALSRAVRYVDRLIALDQGHWPGFFDLQGVIHYEATDLRGAQEAFQHAAQAGSPIGTIGLALVAYAQNRVAEAREQLNTLKNQLPTDHALQEYLKETLRRINDNAEKEQVRDRFERADLGQIWSPSRNGPVGPELRGNALVIAGTLAESEKEVVAERQPPVKGGRFVSAEVTMTLGNKQQRDAWAGLRVVGDPGRSGPEFSVELVAFEGEPQLRVKDGQPKDGEVRWQKLEGVDAEPGKPHTLAIELANRDASGNGTALLLRVYWDGKEVHVQDVNRLSASSSSGLHTELCVHGKRGAVVDATFDDFRLVRRKER